MVISHCITIMVTAETVELQQLQLTETSSRISQKLPSLHHEWFPWTFFQNSSFPVHLYTITSAFYTNLSYFQTFVCWTFCSHCLDQ